MSKKHDYLDTRTSKAAGEIGTFVLIVILLSCAFPIWVLAIGG